MREQKSDFDFSDMPCVAHPEFKLACDSVKAVKRYPPALPCHFPPAALLDGGSTGVAVPRIWSCDAGILRVWRRNRGRVLPNSAKNGKNEVHSLKATDQSLFTEKYRPNDSRHYDSKASPAFEANTDKTFDLHYADGSHLRGFEGKDMVQLGDYEALSPFGVITDCNRCSPPLACAFGTIPVVWHWPCGLALVLWCGTKPAACAPSLPPSPT